MARNNVHFLCRNCYEIMKNNRVVTYAGGKTRNGVCASCGNGAKVRRYNVELDAPSSDESRPVYKPVEPKPKRREVPKLAQDKICVMKQPQADVYSMQLMEGTPVPLILGVDIRTYRALEGMSKRWGRSMSETVDLVVRRYRMDLRRRKENANA